MFNGEKKHIHPETLVDDRLVPVALYAKKELFPFLTEKNRQTD